jgi:endogenous inhibitor of DNA gyrase (YacG/DUF329 family)
MNEPEPADNRPRPSRKCPICGKPATEEAYPFCSRRCADVDLNRWLSGSYAIAGEKAPDGPAEEDDE